MICGGGSNDHCAYLVIVLTPPVGEVIVTTVGYGILLLVANGQTVPELLYVVDRPRESTNDPFINHAPPGTETSFNVRDGHAFVREEQFTSNNPQYSIEPFTAITLFRLASK